MGLRAEQAYTTSNLLEPDPQVFENDYFKVYPSIYAGYAFTEKTTLQASYSRRIERPAGTPSTPSSTAATPLTCARVTPSYSPS